MTQDTKTPSTIVVCVTQPLISDDARTNGNLVRAAMREAASQGARLVVFPEGMISGYAKEQIADWDTVNWAAVTAEVETIATLAAELNLWVVVGSAHPLSPPNRPHNSLYVISDQGDIVDRYDKRFCSLTETTQFFSPGVQAVTFDLDGYRFGCVICVEINFPALFMEYDELGVDCLLMPSYPVDEIFYTKARAHAAIHDSWIALSVPRQSEHLMASSVIGPAGDVCARVDPTATLVMSKLDRDAPEVDIPIKKAKPWRTAARSKGYYPTPARNDPRSLNRTAP